MKEEINSKAYFHPISNIELIDQKDINPYAKKLEEDLEMETLCKKFSSPVSR